jgi:hypothetical protein
MFSPIDTMLLEKLKLGQTCEASVLSILDVFLPADHVRIEHDGAICSARRVA